MIILSAIFRVSTCTYVAGIRKLGIHNLFCTRSLNTSNHFIYHCEYLQFSSVQFSRSVMSNSLRPHESHHARSPCPSPTPGAHSDSCPSSQWCHPAISSSVVPFLSCPQSLPASESKLPEPEIKLLTSTGSSKKAREFQKNIYFCFTDYAKSLIVWITTNCGKFIKRWEYQTTWPASWEICIQVKKQQLEPDMEWQTGLK